MSAVQRSAFSGGFVLHPDIFYSPSYRISPFRTEDVAKNLQFARSVIAHEELDRRFEGRGWRFTENGKEGISLALQALALKPLDCVTILTTTGNSYISGCVTREIEKVCTWSHTMQDNTATLFVNHEFGYPYRGLAELRRYGLPIIEDACHSFLADTPAGDMGDVGDFIVFSLPKVFPIQMGGIVSFDARYQVQSRVQRGGELESYLANVVSHYLPQLDQVRAQRLDNHRQMTQRFEAIGCHPRFVLLPNDVPGVFVFTVPEGIDLPAMKQHGWAHGIECSVFYGERAFFIPIHQHLREADLDYFYTVFSTFILRHRHGVR
jgi:hypothetical protein